MGNRPLAFLPDATLQKGNLILPVRACRDKYLRELPRVFCRPDALAFHLGAFVPFPLDSQYRRRIPDRHPMAPPRMAPLVLPESPDHLPPLLLPPWRRSARGVIADARVPPSAFSRAAAAVPLPEASGFPSLAQLFQAIFPDTGAKWAARQVAHRALYFNECFSGFNFASSGQNAPMTVFSRCTFPMRLRFAIRSIVSSALHRTSWVANPNLSLFSSTHALIMSCLIDSTLLVNSTCPPRTSVSATMRASWCVSISCGATWK